MTRVVKGPHSFTSTHIHDGMKRICRQALSVLRLADREFISLLSVGCYCVTAVCSPDCANGGQCVAPSRCLCVEPFTGPSCDDDTRSKLLLFLHHLCRLRLLRNGLLENEQFQNKLVIELGGENVY